MTFEQLTAEPQHLLLKCVSGSRAYNLSLPSSDTDIKGIFVLPQKELYGLSHTAQVSNASHDEVFFEIGRFIDLLCKNNPNILELLSTPADCVLYRHPLMSLIRAEDFLSKLCLDSFAGYAKTQIKKATGLNKKINRSFEKDRKSVLDFCYVVEGKGTLPMNEWLEARGFLQENCGLVALSHFRDAYLLYHQLRGGDDRLAGILGDTLANDVRLSSVPAGLTPMGVMHFNKDAYSVYCREYREYWKWVDERNDERYHNTLAHGQGYDAKNMMHTFRLLTMAEEIARYQRVIVHRSDREFLLRIRAGEFSIEELMGMIGEKMSVIEDLYSRADLPQEPDAGMAERLLVQIREEFYRG
jgi:predicted nucleotidyltransferase